VEHQELEEKLSERIRKDNLKLLDEELKKEKERKEQIKLEGILQGIIVIKLDDTVSYVNREIESITGIPADQIIGSDFRKEFLEGLLYNIKPYYLEAKRNLKPVFYKVTSPMEPSSRFSYQVGWSVPLMYGKKFVGMIVTINDLSALIQKMGTLEFSKEKLEEEITEKVKELRDFEEKYYFFMDNLPVIAFRGTLDYIPIFFHGAVQEITGYKESDFLIGRPRWDKLIYPEDFEKIVKPQSESIRTIPNFSEEREYRIIQKNGELKWVHEFISNISDKAGKPYLVQGVMYDISYHKKAEQKIKTAEEECIVAYNHVNFYQDLFSHNLYNILSAIQSTGEYLSTFKDDPEKLKEVGTVGKLIKDHVKKGLDIIAIVEKLAAVENSIPKLRPIFVKEVLDKAIDKIVDQFKDRNVRVNVEGLSRDIRIQGDEFLTEIFENLLSNAVIYNDDKEEIQIRIILSNAKENDTDYLKFEMIDNGVGISDRKKKILLEKTPIDLTQSGLGLGLSLIKRIVDRYRGKIWIENRVEEDYKKGSNIVVLFPRI